MLNNMEQGTHEWLEWRKNKITSSDAPVIMNNLHFGETPYQLWQRKMGLKDPKVCTHAMQEGHDKEDQARLQLEEILGVFLLPQIKQHPSVSWMAASLDCIDAQGKILAEIKSPGRGDHEIAERGLVPAKYIPQIQHQLEVCQLEVCFYFSFYESKGTLVKIFRDETYIKKMFEKEKQFYEYNMQEFVPPDLTDRDYEVREDNEWISAAEEWIDVSKRIKFLETQQSRLRDNLIQMSGRQSSMGAGVKVAKVTSKGHIDYKAIPELKSLDLEIYRKKCIESWRITTNQ